MCDIRSNTIIDICRRGADAEHALGEILAEIRNSNPWPLKHTRIREAVAARGGTEALRFLNRALEESKAREMVER